MRWERMGGLGWCGRGRGERACGLTDLRKAMQGKLHNSFL